MKQTSRGENPWGKVFAGLIVLAFAGLIIFMVVQPVLAQLLRGIEQLP
jgi:hypothetical protein